MTRTMFYAAAALFAMTGAAVAQPLDIAYGAGWVQKSTRINLSAFDMETAPGAKAAYRTIKQASNRVCDSVGSSRLINRQAKACFQETLARTVDHVDRPLVTALYVTEYGRNASVIVASNER